MVFKSIAPGGHAAAARTALEVKATVTAAAVAKAEQTAVAAVLVARAVAAAADAVAATTAAAADAIEVEVREAALAMRALTAATAQQLAANTVQRAAALALATQAAAAAADRLHAAQHDRTVAHALQKAMLTELPDSPSLQMAARYHAAAEQDQVGGDWYDAVALPSGATLVVIGDVIGHDIVAAATMGQLRNMLRTLAWDRDEAPSAIVTRLDRAMRGLRIDTMATIILLSIDAPDPDPNTGVRTVRWTNAGHPAPALLHRDGTAVLLDDSTDIVLGVRPDTPRRDLLYAVPPGATLVLYTDGLIETRTQDLRSGQERLLATLRTNHRLDPDELVDAVLAALVAERTMDDVAVIAVRFRDAP